VGACPSGRRIAAAGNRFAIRIDIASPIAIVLLCGVVGLVDVSVRGERILWANLGVQLMVLYAAYAAAAVPAECLLALVHR
jgi:hypothetical protein